MSLFRRRDPLPTPPHPPVAILSEDVISFAAAHHEEFRIADAVAAPELDRLRAGRVTLRAVLFDADRGSADLTFADSTVIRCATGSPEVHQLAAATQLAETHLHASIVRHDCPGRLLVFSAAHWNVYLPVDIAVVVTS